MVIALIDEASWMASLGDLPAFAEAASHVVVIAPHPDDETLAAGGFIAAQRARGVQVTVVAVTDGEGAYVVGGDAELGVLRSGEQTKALARLGVDAAHVVRLRLPDSNVEQHEQELVRLLLPYVSKATHIVAPWTGDFHPDHEACGRAAHEVARLTGAALSFWFFWTWHRGTPASVEGLPLRAFALSGEQMQAKAEALRCHRSQLERGDGAPILPEDLLGPARRPFEVFLPA